MQTRFWTILKLSGNYCLSVFSVFLVSACVLGPDNHERLAGTHLAFDAGDCGAAMIVAKIVLNEDTEDLLPVF